MKTMTCSGRVLVVDDDPDLLDLIAMRLRSAGYDVALAASGQEALEIFRMERPRVVITDLRMDGMDGHALFARLHEEAPSVPVIILTAHGTIPDAVAATQRGVFSFLTKPFDGRELLARIAAALDLSPPIAADRSNAAWRRDIISCHAGMEELLRNAYRLASTDLPLLLSGPRGSGKELLARAIHAVGQQARRNFAVLRCGPGRKAGEDEKLLATALVEGQNGTLFIDDIDLLPAAQQARLLPLVGDVALFFGAARPNCRIIAATSQPLEAAVREGRFRADLYYNLERNALALPSLNERREDIPLLIAHFTALQRQAQAGIAEGFAPQTLALMQDAPWPGNVRQLRSIVVQAMTQTVTPQVPAALVRRLLQEDNAREMAAFDEARRAFEYDYLARLLKATRGNVAQAARIAQRNRTEFYKLLSRHELDPASFKSAPG